MDKVIEKYIVGKYIVIHTILGEYETYDITTPNTAENRWIMREWVKNDELLSRQYGYSGYEYDFVTEKWYLRR